jgi:energy-coupling factor transport system substrate-specific component
LIKNQESSKRALSDVQLSSHVPAVFGILGIRVSLTTYYVEEANHKISLRTIHNRTQRMTFSSKTDGFGYKVLVVILIVISLVIALDGLFSYATYNSATGAASLLAGEGWRFGQTFLNLGTGFWAPFGAAIFVIGTALFLMELRGITFEGLRLRRFSLRWDSTEIAIMALCAATYAAGILATSYFVIIPGVAPIRVANCLPLVFGLLFGLPGAFGSAIGNLIADAFGGFLATGSIAGFVASFLFAYIPYKFVKDSSLRSSKGLAQLYIWGVLVGSFFGIVYTGWFLFFIGPQSPVFANFPLTGLPSFLVWGLFIPAAFVNDLLASAVLSAPITIALYPLVKKRGLFWRDRIRFRGNPKLADADNAT